MEKIVKHQMYDNKKIVTYLMALPYVEIPYNHLNFVFEEEYIILENAYNCKKIVNLHPLQIEWDTNFVGKNSYTCRKNIPSMEWITNVLYFFLETSLIILKGLQWTCIPFCISFLLATSHVGS